MPDKKWTMIRQKVSWENLEAGALKKSEDIVSTRVPVYVIFNARFFVIFITKENEKYDLYLERTSTHKYTGKL